MSYIWEKEVKEINDNKVLFIDGTEEEFTATQMKYVVTDEPKDPSAYTDMLVMHYADYCLEWLKMHDLPRGLINKALNLIVQSEEMKFATAIGKAFGTFKENMHPANFPESIKPSHIEKFN